MMIVKMTSRKCAQRPGFNMLELQDTDKMPWGKYEGHLMQDVPASYCHWLWTNERDPMSLKAKTDPVANYIQRNMAALKKEYPDGIWEEA